MLTSDKVARSAPRLIPQTKVQTPLRPRQFGSRLLMFAQRGKTPFNQRSLASLMITQLFAEHDYCRTGGPASEGADSQQTHSTRNKKGRTSQSTKPCPVRAARSVQLLSAVPQGSDYPQEKS